MHLIPLTFKAFEELEPGPKWQGVFELAWPEYRRWFLQEGEEARPNYGGVEAQGRSDAHAELRLRALAAWKVSSGTAACSSATRSG